MNRRSCLHVAAAALAGLAFTTVASAYPTRPIHWVVPYTAGGATDAVARTVGQALSRELGQPVVVENRPGAASNIGTAAVVRAAPDGHTVLLATPPLSVNGLLFPNLGFDPAKDLRGIAMVARNPNVFVVPAASPFKTVGELVAQARKNPDTVTIGSPGIGTVPHLASLLLGARLDLKVTPVPYKGSAPLLADLLGERLSAAMDNMYAQMPHIRSGKVRVLAVLAPERSASLPDAPGMKEVGIPALADFDGAGWIGMVGPAGMPETQRQHLGDAVVKVLGTTEVRQRLEALGLELAPLGAAAYDQLLASEARRWQDLIRQAGVKLEP